MLTTRCARTAPGALVVLLAVTLTACSGGSATGSAGSPASAVPAGSAAKGQQVLAQSAGDLRKLVNSLTAPASGRQPPYVVCPPAAGGVLSTTPACTGFDAQGPCVAGAADQAWPQRWGYDVNLQLPSDALAAGATAVRTLANAHWATRRNPSTTYVRDFSAALAGVSLRVVADDMPGVLTVEGYGPCVNADGTIHQS
jgi:hypothetical protein